MCGILNLILKSKYKVILKYFDQWKLILLSERICFLNHTLKLK